MLYSYKGDSEFWELMEGQFLLWCQIVTLVLQLEVV